MDFRIFISTFFLIFLAELGDKTQLAALTLSAKEKTPLTIFAASMLAFLLSTTLAVLFGTFGSKLIPAGVIEKVAAIFFITVGFLIFFKKI
ncbi:TMEM165/GDT1 family protein [Candidatus Microgenomates bacterium]|nr:MAG: TMEM165/GDT1 family protein [Candidatus Microgenomates bacterium]